MLDPDSYFPKREKRTTILFPAPARLLPEYVLLEGGCLLYTLDIRRRLFDRIERGEEPIKEQ